MDGNPLQKQFEMLLQKENQGYAGLDHSLASIFGAVLVSSVQVTKPAVTDFAMLNRVQELEEQIVKLKNCQSPMLSRPMSTMALAPNPLRLDPYLSRSLEINPGQLITKEVISQGGFSIVYKGVYKGTDVAVKQIFDPNITDDLLDQVATEIQSLAMLRHPHIIQIMGIVSPPQTLSILTEYMPLTLFQILHKSQVSLKDEQRVSIARQLAKALLYIHLSAYVHRDIKTHNILLDHRYNLKLCDFGLTTLQESTNKGLNQFWGTPSYMAPELLQKKPYDNKIDVFAFGNVLYELFERSLPWDGT